MKRIVVNNIKGYNVIEMESAAISEAHQLEVLMEVVFHNLDTDEIMKVYFHDPDTILFINTGPIAQAFAGTHRGMMVRHMVVRSTGLTDEKHGAITFTGGHMLSNFKERFSVTLRNPACDFEHVLVKFVEDEPTEA